MLRGTMLSSAICDLGDGELEYKLSRLSTSGVNFFSSLLTICRPRFCSYPFKAVQGLNGLSTSVYDLYTYYDAWWNHLDQLVSMANKFGLGIQYDILNEPTPRSAGEWMCFTNNAQGLKPSLSAIRNAPTGVWAEVLESLCLKLVPYLNGTNLCAVLGVLEGSNSGSMEYWLMNTLRHYGLKPSAVFITNSNGPGIKSPHPKSIAAFKKAQQRGFPNAAVVKSCMAEIKSTASKYPSTDGWEVTANEMKQIVAIGKAKGWLACEYWTGNFSDGSNASAYSDRTRPSAGYIANKCGGQIKQLVS